MREPTQPSTFVPEPLPAWLTPGTWRVVESQVPRRPTTFDLVERAGLLHLSYHNKAACLCGLKCQFEYRSKARSPKPGSQPKGGWGTITSWGIDSLSQTNLSREHALALVTCPECKTAATPKPRKGRSKTPSATQALQDISKQFGG